MVLPGSKTALFSLNIIFSILTVKCACFLFAPKQQTTYLYFLQDFYTQNIHCGLNGHIKKKKDQYPRCSHIWIKEGVNWILIESVSKKEDVLTV